MASGSSGRRRTAARKTSTSARSSKKKSAKRQEENDFIRDEIKILLLFAISVLLLISTFGIGGAAGNFVSSVLFGLFGIPAYLMPVGLFLVTAFSISNRENSIAIVKVAAMILAFFLLCTLLQLICGEHDTAAKAADFYLYSAEHKLGGGLFGGLIAKLLTGAFGTIGAWILTLVLLIMNGVIITERSFVKEVKRGGQKVYDTAREDAERHRLMAEERREARKKAEAEQALLREEEQEQWEEQQAQREEERAKRREEAEQRRLDRQQEAEQRRLDREQEAELKRLEREEKARERAALREKERLEREAAIKARTEHKLSGVALEGTSLRQESRSDEMRELTLDENEPQLKDLDELFMQPRTQTGLQPEVNAQADAQITGEADGKNEAEADYAAGSDVNSDIRSTANSMQGETAERYPEDMAYHGQVGQTEQTEQTGYTGQSGHSEYTGQGEYVGQTESASRTVQNETRRVQPREARTTQTTAGSVRRPASGAAPSQAAQPAEAAAAQDSSSAYQFPPLNLLALPKNTQNPNADQLLHETAMRLQKILRDFGVGVTVTNYSRGPAVTRYEVQPDQGVKVSKIVSLADDIKLNLAVADVRIEAPIPGKAAVGIEVPNAENSTVYLRELVGSPEFRGHKSRIAFAVGKDIAGKIMVTDIAKMPHLLIAGATGSGKSVCINTLIMSILYKASPEDVKLIMIDPKVVELSAYNGIPHLLDKVVTDPKKAAGALNWAVGEMTRRYKLFAEYNVRNLEGYNEKVRGIAHIEDEDKPRKLPQIVIVVDELADLMMVAPGEVEDAICRLAQLARAAGIHLIIATQRPSVNVITGLIKANMPSRIAFAVSSGVDSRTILDMNGAEKLLGKGDMLFYPYGYPKPVRVQGAFVSDEEVGAVVEFLKNQHPEVTYSNEVSEYISTAQETASDSSSSGNGPERDALFAEAGKFIIEKDKASIGMLQRWFKVGFNRAARIMDQLAEAGVVGEDAGTKPREILMTMEEFERYIEESL